MKRLSIAACLLSISAAATPAVSKTAPVCIGSTCFIPVLVADGGIVLNGMLSCPVGACIPASLIPAGGSSSQVQFNNSGLLGGMSKTTTDGVHIISGVDTTYPLPDAGSLAFDFSPAAPMDGPPPLQLRVEGAFQLPTPVSWFAPSEGTPLLTPDFLTKVCHYPDGLGGGGGNMLVNVGTAQNLANTGGGTTAVNWDAGSPIRKHRLACRSAAGASNSWSGIAAGTTEMQLVPAAGFRAWMRWAVTAWDGKSAGAVLMGYATTTSFPSTTSQPSSLVNSLYFGCDSLADPTTLQACSNDGSGAATCNDIAPSDGGPTFKCHDQGRMYDGVFWAAPNEGVVHWSVTKYDEVAAAVTEAHGIISTDLPGANTPLNWRGWFDSGLDAGASSTFTACNMGECLWIGY